MRTKYPIELLIEALRDLPPGARVPSRGELIAEYGVAQRRVQSVLAAFEDAGALERKRHKVLWRTNAAAPKLTMGDVLIGSVRGAGTFGARYVYAVDVNAPLRGRQIRWRRYYLQHSAAKRYMARQTAKGNEVTLRRAELAGPFQPC